MRGHETKIETKEEVIKQRNKKKKKKNGMEVTARVHLLLPAGHSIKGPRPLMDGYLFRVSFLFFRRRRHRRRCCCCCSPRPSLSFLANSFRSFFLGSGVCVCVCVCVVAISLSLCYCFGFYWLLLVSFHVLLGAIWPIKIDRPRPPKTKPNEWEPKKRRFSNKKKNKPYGSEEEENERATAAGCGPSFPAKKTR